MAAFQKIPGYVTWLPGLTLRNILRFFSSLLQLERHVGG